jgi:membrane associated rhomboid family serine protease
MNQMQFQAPKITQINKIILATAVCFLASSILKAVGAFSLPQYLGLSANGLFHGLIFQLVTYPFMETQLMSFLFSGLILWFIGSELESQWGQKIYIRFLLITVVGVGLIYSLINLLFFFGTPAYFAPILGLSGVNFALLIAYSMLYPDRQMAFMMLFPMKARTFCWLLVGIEAYVAVFTSVRTSWAHLLAMGIGFLIIHFQSNPIIKMALNSTWTRGPKKSSGKKHLYVVKDEDEKPPKYWQ